MKFSVTIPQLFYDLIARVIPGFLFYCVFKFLIFGLNINIPIILNNSQSNFASTIGTGVGVIVIFYFLGIILNSFVFMSFKEKIKVKYSVDIKDKFNGQKLNDLYQCIRLENEGAGFRLVKLRAEAKFVDILRSSLFILLIVFSIYSLLNFLHILDISNINIYDFVAKFLISVLIIIGLRIQEKKCWDRYYGNIVRIYPIICIKNDMVESLSQSTEK